MQSSRVPVRYLLLVFAVFVVTARFASQVDVDAREAQLLSIVRDTDKIEPAAFNDVARLIARNFRTMIDRAELTELPVAVPLDLWTMLVGGSIFAARLPAALACCIAAAALMRAARRFGRRLPMAAGWAVLVLVSIVYFISPMRLVRTIDEYRATRAPTEPVLTLFRDESPLGYYQAQVDLRRGIGVDLGWRAFNSEEIARVAGNLGDGTVWVLLDVDADMPFEQVNAALIESGRALTRCRGLATHIAVLRYEVTEFVPTVSCGTS